MIFTTNFDELIEDAHQAARVPLRVSAHEEEFKARLAEKPAHHLVKVHGSIDRPDTIILTRDDYSRARTARREMFANLRHDLANPNHVAA